MKYQAVIKNEKGEKEIFQSETPSQAIRELVKKTSLKGEKFAIIVKLKKLFWKRTLMESLTDIPKEDLAQHLNQWEKQATCLECPEYPICAMLRSLSS